MTYITGDTHGFFERVNDFCEEYATTTEDILIILGDAGVNYHLDRNDTELKRELREFPITLFMIHGNHEERPIEIVNYEEIDWHGGVAYVEEEYPNLIFAKDGEIYDIDGRKCIAIGGAYSVDKGYRLAGNLPWFESEQPSDNIKKYVEEQLDRAKWHVDYVFSHTAPSKYVPVESFLPHIDQNTVDCSTEEWLDTIEERLDYERWFLGAFSH